MPLKLHNYFQVKNTQHLLGHSFFKVAAVFWTFLIFYLCLKNVSNLPPIPFENFDKIIHFVFYFIFVFLWIMSFKNISFSHFLIVFFIALLLGIGIEYLQENFTKNRVFDWLDIVANALGAIMSFILVKFYVKVFKRT